MSRNFSNPALFLLATQFVHYCRYIGTYYYRKEVNYGLFKRDVLFFKCVALAGLAFLVLRPFAEGEEDLRKGRHLAAFAAIAAGYAVSMAATKALGIDGTYFGIELGFVKADPQ